MSPPHHVAVIAATTAPEWIAAIGGSLSLLLAFRILLRDRARAIASQAEHIACWRREEKLHYTPEDATDDDDERIVVPHDEVHVHNASNRPITNVGHRHRRMSKPEVRRAFPAWELEHFAFPPVYDVSSNLGVGLIRPESPAFPGAIMPGETAVWDADDPEANSQYQRRWVYFRDANGVGWLRDLSDGRLLKAGSLRARYRLRRGWLWQTFRVQGARESFHWWENA
jgi:hypothetical protein